jgi:iron complex transport system substrate-binding protein
MSILHSLLTALSVFLLSAPFVIAETAPMRIVSTNTTADEILWAMLANSPRVISYSELVNDQRYSNIAGLVPAEKQGRFGRNLEELIRAKPDLVLISAFNRSEYPATLNRLKIPHLQIGELKNFHDVEAMIAEIGRMVGKVEAAKNLSTRTKQRLAALKAKPCPKSVFVYSPGGMTAGSNTMIDAIISAAGASNAAASMVRGFQKMSRENLARLRVDAVIYEREPEAADPLFTKFPKIIIAGRLLSATSQFSLDAAEAIQAGLCPPIGT